MCRLGGLLSDLCQQSARLKWQMCFFMSFQHFQLLGIVYHLPSRLCNLFRKFLQSVLQLSPQQTRPDQRSLPSDMQQIAVFRHHLIDMPILRLELLKLFRRGSL